MVFERLTAANEALLPKRSECGQTLVEYSLILGLLAVTAIAGLSLLAGGVDSLWGWIGTEVSNVVDSALS